MILKSNPVISAVVISILYGAVIELLQEYVFVNRSGDVRDVIADSIGSLIGIWGFNRGLKKRLPSKSSP